MQSTSLYFNAKMKVVRFSFFFFSPKTSCSLTLHVMQMWSRLEEEEERKRKMGRRHVGDAYYSLSRGENDTSFSVLKSPGNKSINHLFSDSLWTSHIWYYNIACTFPHFHTTFFMNKVKINQRSQFQKKTKKQKNWKWQVGLSFPNFSNSMIFCFLIGD